MSEDQEVKINLTEIVRREVKEALKSILTETVHQATGDYTNNQPEARPMRVPSLGDTSIRPVSKKKPKTDGNGDGDGSGQDGDEKHTRILPVKVVKSDGSTQFRRKKRTRNEMKEAITNALPIVQAKHPDWSERRIKRLAKNLVRRYKL